MPFSRLIRQPSRHVVLVEVGSSTDSSFDLEALRRQALANIPKKAASPDVAVPPDQTAEPATAPRVVPKGGISAPVPAQPLPEPVHVPGAEVERLRFRPHPLAAQNATVHRTRPEMGPAHQLHNDHMLRYQDPNAKILSIRHLGGGAGHASANHVFHAQQDNDHEKAIKPLNLDAMHETHEPHHAEARHNVVYDWLSSIGAHHMGVPAFAGEFPSHDKIPKRGNPYPDENDSENKRKTMVRHYAGAKAHIVKWARGSKRVRDASPEELAKVDPHHRGMGIITDLLFSQSDRHGGNVLLDPSGHPILIDHDLILNSLHNQVFRKVKGGKKEIKSVFAPGEVLSYNANGEEIGTNFSPEIKAVLTEIAQGGWKMRHALSYEDALELQQNAADLLTHGVEKTLAMRHVTQMDNGTP